jgi:hypothetical protein
VLSSAFFARGQKTKHRIIYTSRLNTLLPVLLFLLLLLIWSLPPSLFTFFIFWISKCSHLLLSLCCPGFYTRREVDHGEYVDVAFERELSVGGLILLEMKHAAIDFPLLCQNGKDVENGTEGGGWIDGAEHV